MKNLILAFILISLISNCSQENDEPLSEQFTGEELFSSLFFLQGNAVPEISQLSSLRQEIEQAIEGEFDESITTIKDEVIKTISENNLDFFDQFQSDIQSGDHLRIENAIEYGTMELRRASRFILDNQIDKLAEEIRTLDEIELKEYLGEDQILKINDLKSGDPELLKEFLFNEFISQIRFDPAGRQTCLAVVLPTAVAVGVVVVVAAGGVFDVGISMNVVIGYNYALASYTYVVSTGETGQTWMFFNAGVINYLASWGSGDDCETYGDCNPDEHDDTDSQSSRVVKSLSFELFVNEIAENLSSHAS